MTIFNSYVRVEVEYDNEQLGNQHILEKIVK